MTPMKLPPGTPATDLAVLTYLARPEHRGLDDIAKHVDISRSTARRAVRRLQLLGHVTPDVLPIHAEPTAKGRQWLAQIGAQVEQAGREGLAMGRLRRLAGQLESISEELREVAQGLPEVAPMKINK